MKTKNYHFTQCLYTNVFFFLVFKNLPPLSKPTKNTFYTSINIFLKKTIKCIQYWNEYDLCMISHIALICFQNIFRSIKNKKISKNPTAALEDPGGEEVMVWCWISPSCSRRGMIVTNCYLWNQGSNACSNCIRIIYSDT